MSTECKKKPSLRADHEIVKYYRSSEINGLGRVYLILIVNLVNNKLEGENYFIFKTGKNSIINEALLDDILLETIFNSNDLEYCSLEEIINKYKEEICGCIQTLIFSTFKDNTNNLESISVVFQDYNSSFFFYELFDKFPTSFFDKIKVKTNSKKFIENIDRSKIIRETGEFIKNLKLEN
ncbi:MAG: hypothetical protein A2Y40_03175 [Candidatus Margulisbacteria bacterium GWF2_35_9]|nr:MAG: hypothetical protein A2Y40_03175 [Candidatus Margulisbacteria bacterium GWF2_35_9]